MYTAAVLAKQLPNAIEIIAEQCKTPSNEKEELETVKSNLEWEIIDAKAKPETSMPELLHEIAYSSKGLGNSTLIHEDKIDTITQDSIQQYTKAVFRPERTVIVGIGMEHEYLEDLVTKHFDNWNTRPSVSQTILPFIFGEPKVECDFTSHPYTGGERFEKPPEQAYYPTSQFSHMQLAFEGLPLTAPDQYALAVLQILMGGGGSFSAGGPGKGMFSRLYTRLLNQYGFIESANCFNHSYTTSGLFGISACTPYPSYNSKLFKLLCEELSAVMRGGLTASEIQRAKNMLRSSMLMNLESRMVTCEDIGRQIQTQGFWLPLEEMSTKIEAVTVQDVVDVANKVCRNGVPTLVCKSEDSEDLQRDWQNILRRSLRV